MVRRVLMVWAGILFVVSLCQAADVKVFVTQNFETGIPFEEAAAFGPEAVPELLMMLSNAQYEPYWGNIVYTLGVIGDPTAVKPLDEFLKNHQGEISWDTFSALQGVPTALGFIGEKGHTEALDLLTQLTDDSYWREARFAVFDNAAVNDAVVRKSLMKSTIVALGYTGQDQAIGALESLKSQPQVMAEFGPDINAAINQ
jgi:HEAT repeat protein